MIGCGKPIIFYFLISDPPYHPIGVGGIYMCG